MLVREIFIETVDLIVVLCSQSSEGKHFCLARGQRIRSSKAVSSLNKDNIHLGTALKCRRLPCTFTQSLHDHGSRCIMGFHYTDTLEKHNWVGGGAYAHVYHVSPTIVVKALRPDLSPEEDLEEHPLLKDIAFYKSLNERQDRCQDIVDCFLALPDHLFLSYCANNAIIWRFNKRQERESDSLLAPLVRVKEYEDPALIARWIQQLTSALEHVEKMGFCHNDLNTTNCLLDENLNLKLTDFGRATTIGQFLEHVYAPWALRLTAGPLKGTYGLCSARTEQFAVGSILYFMVYGHKPHEDINLEGPELDSRMKKMDFPKLDRHAIFDDLISACWHNVYPTMALVAYDFKRKTKDIASVAEYKTIDYQAEKKTCEELVRKGILGDELAIRFQPPWQRRLFAVKNTFFWHFLIGLSRKTRFWLWFRW